MDRRRWIILAIVALALAALVLQRTTAPTRAETVEPEAVHHVSVALVDERTALRGEGTETTPEFSVTIDEWRSWAETHLVDRLGDPVRIGDQAMPPASFDAFGVAAASPNGRTVAFTATTYAMLTTVSIVTLLDLETMTFDVVREPVFGDVEELVWSPGGRFIGYTIGTARAGGEAFRIDDAVARQPAHRLTSSDVLTAAESQGYEIVVDEHEWLPAFRNTTWDGDARVLITTNDPAAAGAGGQANWSVMPRATPAQGD